MRKCALLALAFATACGPSPHHPATGDDHPDIDAPKASDVDAAACASSTATATEAKRPVDIIWVIDNSGSMGEEETRIQQNMNAFATSIAASGVDYHVIVIADTTHISVPPPLGGSPQLLQLNINIDSHDALQMVVQSYAMYQSFLRPTSVKHIVVVSDDESNWSKAMVESGIAGLTAPGFGTDWRLDAVVAEAPPWAFGNHCFALSAAVGQVYLDLQVAHMGLFFSLCDTDWSPLFVALAQSVSTGLSLPCTYALPMPPNGETLDPALVNFVYTPTGGSPQTIANVGDLNGCGSGPGWYYDNPTMPTQIITCPATCTVLEGDGTGKVDVQFGCSTVIQ